MKTRFLGIVLAVFLMLGTNPAVYSYDSDYSRPSSNIDTQRIFSDYMNNLRFQLQKNWNPPDFLESAQIRVVFRLSRDGHVLSCNVIESSGNDIYDDSAFDALEKANPFDNFPEETMRETLTVNYLFETTLLNIGMTNFYYEKAKNFLRTEPNKALEYINLAIKENGENDNSYFLYKKRAEIRHALGDVSGENEDLGKFKLLKNRSDIKRVHALKHRAEIEKSPYIYFYLAYAYEQISDIDNAILAIDKAISIDSSNYAYKRFKENLLIKRQH